MTLWESDDCVVPTTPGNAGQASIIRFADDFVCTFERESDAKRFREVLVKRLGRFSLELAEEKTKLIRSQRRTVELGILPVVP